MLFNSLDFLIFFPVVTTLYFASPHRFRWILLLGASVWFYASFIPAYLLIILGTATLDYLAGRAMEKWPARRKLLLVTALAGNLATLAVFKYFNFLAGAAGKMAAMLGMDYAAPFFSWALPIGLSFHTFQAMAYLFEVYRGAQKPERHYGIYALYILFYPQLVAGPIERPQRLLPQFREVHAFDADRVASGLRLMLWGLFKKAAIADRLAVLVNTVYSDPTAYEGLPLLLATAAFAVQIYCDFSGYSDVAIGAARVMGFRLMKNFDRPYAARSVAEFWKRWHISLSTWFRDYVYLPLGGNRVSGPKWAANILIVFGLSGLWHGANWTYLIWGGIHGFYYLFARLKERLGLPRLPGLARTAVTFCLVTFAWIFFRAENLSDARHIVTHLLAGLPGQLAALPASGWRNENLAGYPIGVLKIDFAMTAAAVLIMGWVHRRQALVGMAAFLDRRPVWARWSVYYALIFLTLMLAPDQSNRFIYFQF